MARCSGLRVSLDTETNGLLWYKNHIIGYGLWCPDAGLAGYLPAQKTSTRAAAIEAVTAWAPGTTVIGQNLKFDLHMLGIDPATTDWKLIDTAVLAHLVDSRLQKKLDQLERTFLGANSKRHHVTTAPNRPIWEWPLENIADYCINDARVTYDLAELLVRKAVELRLWNLFRKEMEYLKLLWRIERRGIQSSPEFINRALARLSEDIKAPEQRLFDEIGYTDAYGNSTGFNWRSHQKLSKALYDDYGWERPVNPFADEDGVDRTKFAINGKYNSTLTDSFILMEKAHHPLGELVLHLREIDKLKDYLMDYRKFCSEDRVVHTNLNLTGTRTGRLASKEPNLQNIPSEIRSRAVTSVFSDDVQRRVEEYNLRKALVARPGHVFVSIDYRQMEMRMFGVLAREPKMLESLRAGRDIHSDNAFMVWGLRDDVHREWSKTIGFGLIYGMTTGSLQFRLNMTKEQAYGVTDQYWGAFPRVQPWLREVARECRANGFVRYWSGRIWREELDMFMYKAANALIQGGCADLLSVAVIRSDEYLRRNSCGGIVDIIHDEILFEIPEAEVGDHSRNLAHLMEVPDLLDIPFFTDIKIGPSYGDLAKVKEL